MLSTASRTRRVRPAPPRTAVAALEYARSREPRFVAELKELISYPSISGDPRRRGDVEACAAWLADHLRQVGLDSVEVARTAGHPVICAEWSRAPGRPTVLVYGHYDVLPPDPIEAWRSRPFEAVVRGEHLYGRGASDDKGQLFTHVKAVEALLRTEGSLPVNVKFLFEGEEETDSPNLRQYVAASRGALAADVAVISDGRMLGPDRPSISYAQRGTLRLELEVRGPSRDLHSGAFGGAIHNPLQALCEIVAGLHDDRGRIAIPGIYSRVRKAGEEERAALRRAGPSDDEMLDDAGVEHGWGEQGYSLYERTTLRPALILSGIVGGHQGAGVKAIIPSRAVAKLSFRLAADQDPAEVARTFRAHIARIAPASVRATVRALSGAKPAVMKRNDPSMRAAVFALTKGFGAPPVFTRSGGSMPAVSLFQELLGIPTVLMGFGLSDDCAHAANERFDLRNFRAGIGTSIWFLRRMAYAYDH